jgi:hypothetical protein
VIKINKEEAAYLRKRYPQLPIKRTMKQRSQRGHYYTEETAKVLSALKKFNEGKKVKA